MEMADIFNDLSLPDIVFGSERPDDRSPDAVSKDTDISVHPWVSLDLARRQATSRLAHEQSIKDHQPAAIHEIRLSQTSEQLVLDNLRHSHIVVPLPEIDQAVCTKQWTRSANFVFETLKLYGFDDTDIKNAMVAASGSGDVTDMLAWLCFNVSADKMPADMRDKLEQGSYKGVIEDGQSAGVKQQEEAAALAPDAGNNKHTKDPDKISAKPKDPELAPRPAARIDQVEKQDGGDEYMVLWEMLNSLGLDEYDSEGYDSDEDPGVVHARRSVRLQGLTEWLGFLRIRNKGNKHARTLLMLQELVSKEKAALADIEEDFLFDPDQSARESDRLWPEYYEALLHRMCEYKKIEHEREQNSVSHSAADMAADACSSEPKPTTKPAREPADKPVDIFDGGGSDSDCGLGFGFGLEFGFGSDYESDAADYEAPGTLSCAVVVEAIDTAAPAKWKGAFVRTILDEAIRHQDSIAEIRYTTVAAKNANGFTSTLNIVWSAPNKAAQHAKLATREIPGITSHAWPLDAQGMRHVWKLPDMLVGKTKRDAENLMSLVWLFSHTSVPLHLGTRLPPVLRELWKDWETASKQTKQESAARALAERADFLQNLRRLYEAAVLQEQDSPTMPAANSLRIQRPRTLQHATKAKKLRQTKWTGDTIKKRCASAKWQATFGRVQSQLPARQHRSQIVRCILQNQVCIVRGETGSGKSSQIPQFALQLLLGAAAKYAGGRILCTQPRRISAVTIAARVSQELGDTEVGSSNSLVGHQIRFDAKAADQNALVFCTTGILLRVLAENPMLEGISCVICDEVQERTLELDYLLIILRRLLAKRANLKLILMSATIDTAIFSHYFDLCPVVEIPGRTFPVHNIYLENIVQMAEYSLDRTSWYAERRASAGLGGVFTTSVSGRGDSSYRLTHDANIDDVDLPAASDADCTAFGREVWAENQDYVSPAAWSTVNCMRTDVVNLELIHIILHGICVGGRARPGTDGPVWPGFCSEKVPQGAVLVFLPGIKEIRALYGMLIYDKDVAETATIVPLHSSFANDRPAGSSKTYSELAFYQDKGRRKIVLSTNVAETGITIPDVTIVVDSGKSNQAQYDRNRRLTHLETMPISKANVKQRRGRAGRVQPGLSICLFTKAQHELMSDFELPEMRRLPLINLCLLSKAHGVRDIMGFLQDALDPPPQSAVMQAIHELQESGALDEEENLTPIGHHLCYLPLDIPVAKLLIMGTLLNCLDPVLTLAASMSLTNSILAKSYSQSEHLGADSAQSRYRKYQGILPYVHDSKHASDLLVTLAAYEDWRKKAMQPGMTGSELQAFCKARGLGLESLEQLEDFREQYLRLLVELGLVKIDRSLAPRGASLAHMLRPPRDAARHGVRASFVKVPAQANINGDSVNVLYAAIVSALDHIVMTSLKTESTYVIGQTTVAKRVQGIGSAIQIVDRERVATRPIRLHANSAILYSADEAKLTKKNALVAASLSGTSSKTFANDLTKINLCTVMLFARTLEYWPKARQVTINRWIECKCFARTASVLMLMRRVMHQILEYKVNYPAKPLPDDLDKWQRVIISVLRNEGV
ncbi:hypothetical protein H4R99_000866 [Coemansia sp. RSA 1722]|nr:hypothetical protein LPJ57_000338 [Coemansia sp. RSA 486]KAJ2232036.1 hypothetical protein IWW45_005268 [Coemansia sp. RSA 485]KAJ2605772.1 hypothetical protein H4R99_000866 [Coemansia sp. RSA 1722]